MNTQKELSVIICAYTMHRWDDIREAVASVRANSMQPCEIILVSDHNDELLARLREAFPDDTVIPNTDQKGLSGARNTGVRAAHGTYVAFIDDDATVDSNWFAAILARLEEPGVWGAFSAVLPRWIGVQPRWFPDEYLWTVGCTFPGVQRKGEKIRNLQGASMIIGREAFVRTGGFNSALGRTTSKLPMASEESEWCMRAQRDIPGLSFVYAPEVIAWHKVANNRVTWSYFLKRCLAEGISKAHLTRLHATPMRLARERSYVINTLTIGAWANVTAALRHGDMHGFSRAAAIVVGLSAATVGFLAGRVMPMPEAGAVSAIAPNCHRESDDQESSLPIAKVAS